MFIDSDSYPFYLLFEKGSQVHINMFSIEWCLVGCGPGHEGEDGEMPSSPARSSRDFVVSFFPRELFLFGHRNMPVSVTVGANCKDISPFPPSPPYPGLFCAIRCESLNSL